MAALPTPPLQAQVRLPALGETAAEDLSIGAERRLGEQIMREIRRDPAYLDDPVLLEYLQSLWLPLVAAARQLGDIDSDIDRLRLGSLPGARPQRQRLCAARRLRRRAPGPDRAHHHARRAGLGAGARAHARHAAPHRAQHRATAARVDGGHGGHAAGHPGGQPQQQRRHGHAAIMGGQAAAIQGQLNFSRDMEREADRIGFGVLAGAGFAPAGMAGMFDKLDVATG
jgi:predicted Zn-dependent protease